LFLCCGFGDKEAVFAGQGGGSLAVSRSLWWGIEVYLGGEDLQDGSDSHSGNSRTDEGRFPHLELSEEAFLSQGAQDTSGQVLRRLIEDFLFFDKPSNLQDFLFQFLAPGAFAWVLKQEELFLWGKFSR
jgi:hypothetical protein